jgi:hypothetical protein
MTRIPCRLTNTATSNAGQASDLADFRSILLDWLAGSTGLEPAASGVTGRRSNQLNYDPERDDLRIGRGGPPGCHTAGELASEGWWAVQDSNL